MRQPSLFPDPPMYVSPRELRRRTDPQSAREGAQQAVATGVVRGQAMKICRVLNELGAATYREIARHPDCGLSPERVHSRLKPLVERGILHVVGMRCCSVTGNTVQAYSLTAAGLAGIKEASPPGA